MYTLGIDIGSSSSKAVIMKDGKEVVSSAVIQVGTGTSGPDRVMGEVFKNIDLTPEDIRFEVFKNIDLTPEDIRFTVATGYGRFSVEKADKQISEISCHAKGIYFLHPEARTIIDIGGQDAKAIRLDAKGAFWKFPSPRWVMSILKQQNGLLSAVHAPCSRSPRSSRFFPRAFQEKTLSQVFISLSQVRHARSSIVWA